MLNIAVIKLFFFPHFLVKGLDSKTIALCNGKQPVFELEPDSALGTSVSTFESQQFRGSGHLKRSLQLPFWSFSFGLDAARAPLNLRKSYANSMMSAC